MPRLTALKMNPNGIQIHQPRVGGPRRTGDPCRMGHQRLPWETVPQIRPRSAAFMPLHLTHTNTRRNFPRPRQSVRWSDL